MCDGAAGQEGARLRFNADKIADFRLSVESGGRADTSALNCPSLTFDMNSEALRLGVMFDLLSGS